jgi:hypothetical protein
MKSHIILGLGIGILTGAVAFAQDATRPSDGDDQTSIHHPKIQKRLQAGTDATVNTTSITGYSSYAYKRDGAQKGRLGKIFKYAFGRTETGSWGMKFVLPFEMVDPGDSSDKTNTSGLGDIQLRLNRAFKVTDKLRMSMALGARFDTAGADILGGEASEAEDDLLGGGSDVLNLSGHASYLLAKRTRGKFSLIYEGSVQTDRDRKNVSALTPTVGLSGILPYHLLWDVAYGAKFNLSTDDYKDSAKLGLRMLLGERKLWSMDGVIKVPIKEVSTHYVIGGTIARHY